MKIRGQGHRWYQSSKSYCKSSILSTHIPLFPCQSVIPFLRYNIFKLWFWKSKVKGMGEVKVESHNMGPTFSRLTSLSFHVNRAYHSWVTTFSKCDLRNQRGKVMGEATVQIHNVGLTSYRLTHLSIYVNRTSRSWDIAFSKFDFENSGSRSNDYDVAQLHVEIIRTSNADGHAHMGKMGK